MFNNSLRSFYEQKDENNVTNEEKILKNQQVIRRVDTTDNSKSFEKVLYKSDGAVFKEGKLIGFGMNISNKEIYPPENFEIYLRDCDLTGELDLSDKPDLLFVEIYHNRISKINLKGSKSVIILGVQDNELSELDITDLSQCKGVDAGYNKLSELDVSKNSELRELYINNNSFEKINLEGCPKLEYFYCHDNKITELDTRSNPMLRHLNATENPMKKIYALAPQKDNLPLQLFAEEGGSVGLKFSPVYDERWKETGENTQTYYAMPDEGWRFDGWYAPNGELVSKKVIFNDTYGAARILTARFLPEVYNA